MAETEGFEVVSIIRPVTKALIKAAGVPAFLRVWFNGLGRKQEALDAQVASQIEGETEMAAARTAGEIMQMDASYARAVAKELGLPNTPEATMAVFVALQSNDPRHLMNFSTIIGKADKIAEDRSEDIPEDAPSDEWWDRFYEASKSVSSDQLQDFFAAMAAGEVIQPESVSFSAIEVAKRLDPTTVGLFSKWVSKSAEFMSFRFMCTLGLEAGNNELADIGFRYNDLQRLTDIGLLRTDYSTGIFPAPGLLADQPRPDGVRYGMPFYYAGSAWCLEHTGPHQDDKCREDIRLECVLATDAGAELAKIIPVVEDTDYTERLRGYLASHGLSLILPDIPLR